VKGMKSTSFIAPSDWECQSRKEAEPWPCPKGVSSYCRYYDDERRTSRRAATALGGTDFADASDAVLAEVDDMCVRYYCYGLGANGKWSSYPPWNPGDFTDSCCEQFTHFETKVLSDATLTTLGEASGTELGAFTDPGSSGWNAKVATVCGAHDDSTSITNWFKDSYWGYRHWHEDPNVEKHLIHFEINRFEMGPYFGIQLYSPQLDTLRVYTDGAVSFKPTSADFNIDVYEDLEYEPITTVDCDATDTSERRRLDAETKAEREAVLARTDEEVTAERFRGSCHPSDGCRAGVDRRRLGSDTHNREADLSESLREHVGLAWKNRRGLRRGGAGAFSSTSSFSMSSGNRAGNSR